MPRSKVWPTTYIQGNHPKCCTITLTTQWKFKSFYLLLISSLSRILRNVSVNSVFSVKSRNQSQIKLYEQTADIQFLMLSHNTEGWHFIVWQRSRKLSPRASLNHTQEQEASLPNPSLQRPTTLFCFSVLPLPALYKRPSPNLNIQSWRR